MVEEGVIAGLGGDVDAVAKQVHRIFASKTFRQADRIKRFLDFIVKETVAGRAEKLKEFSVGVEVFGRDSSFDPRFDPIVRVQARRLRAQLERYYAEEAAPGELVLEVPKGRYAVNFKEGKQTKVVASKKTASSLLLSRNTVLAMPFADLSVAGDQRSFCGGLNEEIIHTLTRTKTVRLAAWSGATLKDGELDLEQAAARFNASIVISGSVRKFGGEVRVTANLIDTASGCYLWSTSISKKSEDCFALQEEVAQAIAQKLEAEIADGAQGKAGGPPARNLAAYNLYVQGRYHLNQRTEEGLRKAVEFFEKAIAEDGQYAQAYSGLADAYGLLGHYGGGSPAEVWTKAVSNAAWAVLCDEHSAEAHTSLAHVKATQDWDWAGAEQEFKRAITLDFRYPTAHHWYAASLLMPMGRSEEAKEEMLIAQSLDPISPIIARDLAKVEYYMGNFEAALEQCDSTIELDPHFAPAYSLLGFVQESRGEYDEAFAAFQHAIQLSPQSPSFRAALGRVLALTGRTAEAEEILKEMLELATKRYVSPFDLALLHIALDRRDEGFEWLDKAFNDRGIEVISVKVDPRWESVRSDARFVGMVGRLGLASER
jgi:serine/threonine-protein kinase